jgi:nicotinamidase-related amidase
MKYLIMVDMQNDFIDGALGTAEAVGIVDQVVRKVQDAQLNGTKIIFTQDTHPLDYLETQEGRHLPVEHCIEGTDGWKIHDSLAKHAENSLVFTKDTFGSKQLAEYLLDSHLKNPIDEIGLCGLCTDICVISNALLIKAFLPEVEIKVDAGCCAGVSPETHNSALAVMKACQIGIIDGTDGTDQ